MSFTEQIAHYDLIAREAVEDSSIGKTILERVRNHNLSEVELDQLPFGAIQLDPDGVILRYNSYESRMSGVSKAMAMGRHFFTEIAPCTDVKEFHGRFKSGVASKTLFERFRYHFAFKKNPCDVSITLFYSDATQSVWVFVRPD